MSQIVNTLPVSPDNMYYDNLFLMYVPLTDTYRLINFDYLISDTVDSVDVVYCHSSVSYDYYPTSDSWTRISQYLGSGYVSSYIIASTVDIYDSDGSLLCSAVAKDYFTNTISLVSDSITASTFLTALDETKTLLPILIVALVAVIAFRKSWRFLRGCIRGA
ncbi:MAG: hypothetical protein K2J47_08320 [Ruminococcus sp.]|nr:hypothetical protein [Ruminococcus sp.]